MSHHHHHHSGHPHPARHATARRHRHWFDRFGATGSLLCALHCALTPLLLAALPALGLSVWFDGSLEWALVVFVTLLGVFSLGWSYRRHRALRLRWIPRVRDDGRAALPHRARRVRSHEPGRAGDQDPLRHRARA